MNTQIYLLLVRKVNPHLPMAAKVPLMLKNFVMGDSLDAPFLKFIKVQSVSHSIGFAGEDKVTEVVDGAAKTFKTSTGKSASGYNVRSDPQWGGGGYSTIHDRWGAVETTSFNDHRKHTPAGSRQFGFIGGGFSDPGFFSGFKNNQYVNINLPGHKDFVFTKLVDAATPQLAYGCSAQEPFYFAAFFFRRRIGAGIDGMRMPFMGIGLRKCLITGWSLGDEVETITLKYKQLVWGAFDQTADINAPTGLSQRVWDTDKNEGGEKAEGYIIQALIGALTVGGAAAVKGMTGGFEDEVTTG